MSPEKNGKSNLAKGERFWGFKWGVNYTDKEQCNITKSIFRPKEISHSHAGPPMVTANEAYFRSLGVSLTLVVGIKRQLKQEKTIHLIG